MKTRYNELGTSRSKSFQGLHLTCDIHVLVYCSKLLNSDCDFSNIQNYSFKYCPHLIVPPFIRESIDLSFKNLYWTVEMTGALLP
jgi:hypothetical protein